MRLSWGQGDDESAVMLPDIGDLMGEAGRKKGGICIRYVESPPLWNSKPKEYQLQRRGVKIEGTADVMWLSRTRNMVRWSGGRVLVEGLGLGMYIAPMLERECVESLTILEQDAEIVDLMEEFWRDNLLEAHQSRLKIVGQETDLEDGYNYACIKAADSLDRISKHCSLPALVFYENQLFNIGLMDDEVFYGASKKTKS